MTEDEVKTIWGLLHKQLPEDSGQHFMLGVSNSKTGAMDVICSLPAFERVPFCLTMLEALNDGEQHKYQES